MTCIFKKFTSINTFICVTSQIIVKQVFFVRRKCAEKEFLTSGRTDYNIDIIMYGLCKYCTSKKAYQIKCE